MPLNLPAPTDGITWITTATTTPPLNYLGVTPRLRLSDGRRSTRLSPQHPRLARAAAAVPASAAGLAGGLRPRHRRPLDVGGWLRLGLGLDAREPQQQRSSGENCMAIWGTDAVNDVPVK